MRTPALLAAISIVAFAAAARGADYAPGFGPNPSLPKPEHSLIPTVNIAPASSWTEGTAPSAAGGLQVTAFAQGLDHPRWLNVLPNGDVLVAETDAPPRPGESKGIMGWLTSFFMKRAGSTEKPSPNRIILCAMPTATVSPRPGARS